MYSIICWRSRQACFYDCAIVLGNGEIGGLPRLLVTVAATFETALWLAELPGHGPLFVWVHAAASVYQHVSTPFRFKRCSRIGV